MSTLLRKDYSLQNFLLQEQSVCACRSWWRLWGGALAWRSWRRLTTRPRRARPSPFSFPPSNPSRRCAAAHRLARSHTLRTIQIPRSETPVESRTHVELLEAHQPLLMRKLYSGAQMLPALNGVEHCQHGHRTLCKRCLHER